MSMISIGLAGLGTAQSGLQTTSHNIANVHTPGYSQQRALQATATPQFTGAGYIGQGAAVAGITRAYDVFLDLQAREAQTAASFYDNLAAHLGTVDQMFSDPAAGLSPALDEFYGAIGTVAANPADMAARAVLISGSEVLAARVRDIHGRLEALRGGLNAQVEAGVADLNSLAEGVAHLNREIVRALGSGTVPNDLLDQRDGMLRDMAGQIRISTVQVESGAINVSLSNGRPFVLDGQTFAIGAGADPADIANTVVGERAGGTFRPFNESMLTGGALGAAIEFRQRTLDATQNALGRLVGALGSALNAQHALGLDRNGSAGSALFALSDAQVQSSALNAGGATLAATITDHSALTSSDYTVSFDGGNYLVERLADGLTRSFAALPQTIDGFALSLAAGAPAAGDSFKVLPTRAIAGSLRALVSDPLRIAAALPVRAAAGAANSGGASLRVDSVAPPANVNLSQPVSVTFTSATTFNVSGIGTGNPVGLSYTSGMTISFNGWSAQLKGAAAAGDTFSVGPNTNGIGDNGNLVALSALATARLVEGGTLSAGEAYAHAVSVVGNNAHATTVRKQAQDAVLAQADAAHQAISGVNLDEEAANLLKYQQAYQAASRVIATANAIFDEILSISR